MAGYYPPSAIPVGTLADVDDSSAPVEGATVAMVQNPAWDPDDPGAVPRWVAGTVDLGEDAVRDAGRWEVLVDGTPAVAVLTEDEDDWVYVWVVD